MRNFYIVVFLLFTFMGIPYTVSSQVEWAPIGARWSISYTGPALDQFETITSVKDTLVAGKTCRKLISSDKMYNTFLYASGDSVFLYLSGAFRLWIDFSAKVGDTVYSEVDINGNCKPVEKYYYVIDSLSSINVGTEELRVQWAKIITSDLQPCRLSWNTIFIEKIGPTGSWLPNSQLALPVQFGSLLQYYDKELCVERIKPFVDPNSACNDLPFSHPCRFTFSSGCIPLSNQPDFESLGIAIYPQPAQGVLYVNRKTGLISDAALFRMDGSLVRQGDPNDRPLSSLSMDVSGLPPGIYLLRIVADGRMLYHKVELY